MTAARASLRASDLDATLAALSDPTRRHLLDTLATRGEDTATALTRDLAMSRQAVVKHLSVLSRAGLVTGRRAGREQYYAVRAAPVQETAAWMLRVAQQWDRRLRAIKRLSESTDRS